MRRVDLGTVCSTHCSRELFAHTDRPARCQGHFRGRRPRPATTLRRMRPGRRPVARAHSHLTPVTPRPGPGNRPSDRVTPLGGVAAHPAAPLRPPGTHPGGPPGQPDPPLTPAVTLAGRSARAGPAMFRAHHKCTGQPKSVGRVDRCRAGTAAVAKQRPFCREGS